MIHGRRNSGTKHDGTATSRSNFQCSPSCFQINGSKFSSHLQGAVAPLKLCGLMPRAQAPFCQDTLSPYLTDLMSLHWSVPGRGSRDLYITMPPIPWCQFNPFQIFHPFSENLCWCPRLVAPSNGISEPHATKSLKRFHCHHRMCVGCTSVKHRSDQGIRQAICASSTGQTVEAGIGSCLRWVSGNPTKPSFWNDKNFVQFQFPPPWYRKATQKFATANRSCQTMLFFRSVLGRASTKAGP